MIQHSGEAADRHPTAGGRGQTDRWLLASLHPYEGWDTVGKGRTLQGAVRSLSDTDNLFLFHSQLGCYQCFSLGED